MVAAGSVVYLQMVLGFIAGQLIIAYLRVPLFYKMNLVSIYEYLENRFGMSSYRTGAWFFFISKMLGAAVRLFLVCLTLQLLVTIAKTAAQIGFVMGNAFVTIDTVTVFCRRRGHLRRCICRLLTVIHRLVAMAGFTHL